MNVTVVQSPETVDVEEGSAAATVVSSPEEITVEEQ
jgi:hypothetical protein